ncbi:hypothetical protein A3Q56_01043 [Intoshia linei]|uniref:Uncharacterized protein n=1 Tax=Intoshia linei TaxID=1819745 RepID=A0A177BAB7_9BILA|nr:hypothetical protein A3Q56_01043 [Intoshia linei]
MNYNHGMRLENYETKQIWKSPTHSSINNEPKDKDATITFNKLNILINRNINIKIKNFQHAILFFNEETTRCKMECKLIPQDVIFLTLL